MIAHIGFSDAFRILRRILHHLSDNQTTTLPVVGTALSFMGPWVPSLAVFLSWPWVPSLAVFLSWVLGSHPWQFFFHGSLGPIPGCFSFMGPSVPSLDVFLSSRPFGTCFIKPSTRFLADSFSCCLVLGFASHVTRLCFSSWSAGCVLRRRLLMSGSSFTPILGFGSRVSRAVCSFSPDCEFLVVIVHLVLLSRCSVSDFSSGLFLQLHLVESLQRRGLRVVTPALLCGALLRGSRRSCASAVVYHNLVC